MTALELPPALGRLEVGEVEELACKAHLGVWSERRRLLTNSALHWEWTELAMTVRRLAVCAPREHAKSEVFTVNATAWRSLFIPGFWTFIFAQTGDQAKIIKERVDNALSQTQPWMVDGAKTISTTTSVYANWSRVDCAGAGKGVRGAHPDAVLGDDVLSEESSKTEYQRKQTHKWWFGTVGGMAHPWTERPLGDTGQVVKFPPTIVHLVGTPFHQLDLLMSMRTNPMYHFRRYAAEFDETDLRPGTLAVEVA